MECTSYQPEKSIQKISLTPFKTVFRKNNVEKSRCTVPKHQVTFFSKTLDIERDSRVLSVKSFCGGVHDITCHLGKKSSSYLSVTVIYIYIYTYIYIYILGVAPHQDYYIFSRGSLQTFIYHWHPGRGHCCW